MTMQCSMYCASFLLWLYYRTIHQGDGDTVGSTHQFQHLWHPQIELKKLPIFALGLLKDSSGSYLITMKRLLIKGFIFVGLIDLQHVSEQNRCQLNGIFFLQSSNKYARSMDQTDSVSTFFTINLRSSCILLASCCNHRIVLPLTNREWRNAIALPQTPENPQFFSASCCIHVYVEKGMRTRSLQCTCTK